MTSFFPFGATHGGEETDHQCSKAVGFPPPRLRLLGWYGL